MTKSFFSSTVGIACTTAIVLIVGGAVYLRVSSAPTPAIELSSTTVDKGLPDFTSATFETGDAIGSLGPEWTIVSQQDLANALPDAAIPRGASQVRETRAHLTKESSWMSIMELNVVNAKLLQDSLATPTTQRRTVAGREGYVIPAMTSTGGSAFLLVGTSTALMLEYGQDAFGNVFDWPVDVPVAIQSYISAVKVL